MKRDTVTLKTITPLFMSGAERGGAELRPPSFKGIMRFWWRAIIASDNINELKEIESELLGNTKHASKFGIRLRGKAPQPASSKFGQHIKPGEEITIELFERQGESYKFSFDTFRSLFEFSVLLGGFGKRSRRGYGSLQLREWDFKTPDDVINKIKNLYLQLKKDRETKYPDIKFSSLGLPEYPMLRIGNSNGKRTLNHVWVGHTTFSWETLTKEIAATLRKYKDNVFGSINPRQSSAVVISVQELSSGQVIPVFTLFRYKLKRDGDWKKDWKKAFGYVNDSKWKSKEVSL